MIDWLCLTSNHHYYSYIHVENKLANNILCM